MIPLEEIDRAKVPGHDGEITLLKRGTEFSIRTAGKELMNSRLHASEDMLAELTFSRLGTKPGQSILIGGLGMGYTLAAALARALPDTRITVSELVPAVVAWNRKYFGHLAGMPLQDPRVCVEEKDVAEIIRGESEWDAILLDVDNGPNGLTRRSNDRLYGASA
jgi:spermidine synthase